MPKKINIIAAVAENGVIGYQNKLPWRLPEDMKNFKRLTMGHTVIMGRKTFNSLYDTPLPGRDNYILTKDLGFSAPEGVKVCNHFWQAVAQANPDREIFIIGGRGVYREAMEFADKLIITHIHKEFVGDTFFPAIRDAVWKKDSVVSNSNHEFDWDIVTYIRK